MLDALSYQLSSERTFSGEPPKLRQVFPARGVSPIKWLSATRVHACVRARVPDASLFRAARAPRHRLLFRPGRVHAPASDRSPAPFRAPPSRSTRPADPPPP